MLTNDRSAYRKVFFEVWEKYKRKLPLLVEESRLIAVILDHPEWHQLLDNPNQMLKQEFSPEENPFLHISLHLSLQEQIRMDRPAGIKVVYEDLLKNYQNSVVVEHKMLPTLIEMLNKGQSTGSMPSDTEYLVELKKIK